MHVCGDARPRLVSHLPSKPRRNGLHIYVIENHLDEVNCFVGLQDKESGKPLFNVPGLSKKSVTNGIFNIFTVYPMLITIIYLYRILHVLVGWCQ